MAAHHFFIVPYEQDQKHQGRCHQAIDGRGIVQGPHRINPNKIDRQSDKRGDGDDAVETMRLLQFFTQTRLPTEKFRNGVGRGASQNRHTKQSRSDDAQSEQPIGEVSHQWTKRLSGLRRGIDGGDAAEVKGPGRRQHNHESSDGRKEHPDNRINLHVLDILDKDARFPDANPFDFMLDDLFFHFWPVGRRLTVMLFSLQKSSRSSL